VSGGEVCYPRLPCCDCGHFYNLPQGCWAYPSPTRSKLTNKIPIQLTSHMWTPQPWQLGYYYEKNSPQAPQSPSDSILNQDQKLSTKRSRLNGSSNLFYLWADFQTFVWQSCTFWATVCKNGSTYAIGPLSVCLSCPVSITLVYCGQTVLDGSRWNLARR